jgi:AsmA protein
MKRFVQILLGILLVALIAAAAILVLVDPNDFKEDIAAQVEQATGRRLTIEGDLALRIFPRLHLRISDATLAAPPGFGPEPLARIREAEVRADLLPLLSGRLQMDALRMQGLTLRLVRDETGRANWEVPAAGPSPPEPGSGAHGAGTRDVQPPAPPAPDGPQSVEDMETEPAVSAPPSGPPSAPSAGPRLSRLEIREARVTWEDRRTGSALRLDDLALTAGPIARGEPADLNLTSAFAEAGGAAGRVSLTATLSPAPRTFVLDPLDLRLEGLTGPDGLRGSLTLAGRVQASSSVPRFQSEGLVLKAQVAGGPLNGQPLDVEAQGTLDLDLAGQTLALGDLSVREGELRLTGEVQGKGLLDEPVLGGTIALAPLDLRAWLARHGLPVPDTADARALTRFALVTPWRLAEQQLDLTPLELDLDGSRIAGTFTAGLALHPAYRFDLSADRLDLDRYLPGKAAAQPPRRSGEPDSVAAVPAPVTPSEKPAPSTQAPPVQAPAGRPAPAAAPAHGSAPLEPLRALDLEGTIRVADLKAGGLLLGDTAFTVRAQGGRVRIEDSIERFYGGRATGEIGIDATIDPPRLRLVQRAEDIQAGALLQDLTGEARLSGRGALDLDLAAAGRGADALLGDLSGELAIRLVDGQIRGFDLEQVIRRAEARIKGTPVPEAGPEQTPFQELSASATIAGGVLTNRDLRARSDYLHATGDGRVDLAARRLDYRLHPRFVNPPRGRGIKEIEDVPVPVHVTGTFDRPEWAVELGPVLREVAKRRLERELDKGGVLEKLEERTGIKGLEQGLRGLFGR